MGNEFFIAIFAIPMAIGILALLWLAFFSSKQIDSESGYLGLGRKRIAAGFLGSIFSIFTLTMISEFISAYEQGLPHRALSWALSSFILITPFFVIAIALFGFPLYAQLRRFRFGSIFGCLIIALLVSALFAAILIFIPYNLWCESNKIQCVSTAFGSAFLVSSLSALSFGIFARLPVFRSKSTANLTTQSS